MRITSIDEFRGFSIFLMYLANFIILFSKNPPLLLSHAQGEMALPFDIIAPLFGFSMGLSLPFTLTSACYSSPPIWFRTARRAILLFLIGCLPLLFFRLTRGIPFVTAAASTWGILETWALSYTIAFLLFYLRLEIRLVLSFLLALVYQLLTINFPVLLQWVHSLAEGGPLAVLSWSMVAVMGTVVGEIILYKDKKALLVRGLTGGLTLIFLGLIFHTAVTPMNRIGVSAAYIFLGTGLSILIFLCFHFQPSGYQSIFRAAGKYPLLAWVLQGILYVPLYYTGYHCHFTWPLGGLLAAAFTLGLFSLNIVFQKAGIKLKL